MFMNWDDTVVSLLINNNIQSTLKLHTYHCDSFTFIFIFIKFKLKEIRLKEMIFFLLVFIKIDRHYQTPWCYSCT